MDETTARAIAEIAARSGTVLEPCIVWWGESRYEGFRPSGAGEREAFSIALRCSKYSAQSIFVSDNFAGALLRRIGMHPPEALQWAEIVSEGESRQIQTLVCVDDSHVTNVATLGPGLWRSLEIECRMRRTPRSASDTVAALVEVGLQCLVMVLAGLAANGDVVDCGAPEGAAHTVEATRYERSRVNRLRCIREYGTNCWVCDFSFRDYYGPVGEGFVEVHHRVPVSEIPPGYRVDPIRDLIPLCSNCHSMIHARTPIFQPDELREVLQLPAKPLARPTLSL